MRDTDLDAELASANPITEEEMTSAIPPGVGEAMLREITATSRSSLSQRLAQSLFGGRGQVRGRAGFVAALALVVLAVVGLNIVSAGPEQRNLAEPAQITSDGEVGEESAPVADGDHSAISVVTPDTAPDATSDDAPSSTATSMPGSDQSNQGGPAPQAPDGSGTDGSTADAGGTDDHGGDDGDDQDDDQDDGGSQSAGSGPGTTAPPVTQAPGGSEPCLATGSSFTGAAQAYAQQCRDPRADCDQVAGEWICSSGQLGNRPSGYGPVRYAGDCIVVEAEQLELVGAWRVVDDPSAGGGAYIVWEGLSPGQNNDTPTDVLSVSFEVPTPGEYRFTWAMRQPDGVSGDVANTSWVDFPNADRYGPTGGGNFGDFAEVYGFGSGYFTWMGKADQGQSRPDIAIEFSSNDQYTMQIAGRSHGHQIDTIVIYPESVNLSDATAGRCS